MALAAENDEQLYRIVYDSSIMLPFGDAGVAGLENIISVARSRNAQLGITGVLYYEGAYFMQVLEGPRSALMAVFGSIVLDQRHKDIQIPFSGPLARRDFEHWSMALVDEVSFGSVRSVYPVSTRISGWHVAEFIATMRNLLDAECREHA